MRVYANICVCDTVAHIGEADNNFVRSEVFSLELVNIQNVKC